MTVDYEALKFWLSVGQVVGTAAVAVWVYFVSRQKATSLAVTDLDKQINDRVGQCMEQIDERVDKHADRITRAEIRLDHMPTHKDISEISTRIEAMHGEISRMSGTLSGVNRAVDLMNEHLLAANRKKEC
jgi:hypothetical protein